MFDKNDAGISQKLYDAVKLYIEENYVDADKLLCAQVMSERVCLSEIAPCEKPQHSKRKKAIGADALLPQKSACPQPETLDECKFSLAMGMDFDPDVLGKMLESTDAGFSETLLRLIDKTGKKDSEIYKKANVDRKLFSKIRNNPSYKPSKQTALAFAVALELDLEQTRDFIARAGFALSHSSKFDIIIEYFIKCGNYNMFEINQTLFAFDQNLLGA